ncbi:MAG: transcription termination factor Rho, partial [Bacillota bacterium]
MKYNKETLEQMDLWKLRDLATKLGLVDSGFASRTILVEYCVGVSAKKNTPKPIGEEGQAKRGRGRPKKEAAPAPVEPDLEKASTLPKKTADIEEQDTAPKKQFEPKHNKKPFVPLYDGKANKPYKDRNFSQNGKPKTQVKDFRENKDFKDKQQESSQEEYSERSGVLEICADGYGFLRAVNYQNGETDAYIANQKIKKYGLRKGDFVVASVRKIEENRPWGVQEVKLINGESPEKMERRVKFESLTPIHPDDRIKLEIAHEKSGFAVRAMDLVSPIGKGQRGMIVSPPKAGKTTLLKSVAKSISINYPEAHLMVLLIDERPEEVTDMQRSIRGEVVYSTFDELPDHHIKVTELVLERAKRMVELGKDVVILLDSLTRLTRAYNLVINPTGKIL